MKQPKHTYAARDSHTYIHASDIHTVLEMIIYICDTCSAKTCHTYFAKILISELELVKDEASQTSHVRSEELSLQTVLELVSYAILELDTHQQLQLLTHQASTTTPTSRC